MARNEKRGRRGRSEAMPSGAPVGPATDAEAVRPQERDEALLRPTQAELDTMIGEDAE